ncbi:hypothetical protein Tco_0183960 [Tanacetum coccineum]
MQKECSSPSQHKPAKSLNANHKMAEENIPALTRFDDSLVPVKAHLPYFWNTLTQEAKSGIYSFQLDEQWFPLNVDLLCEALEITPVDPAYPFVSLSAGEQVMDFVNELGYPETSGSDKPRHLVLQMLCGIVTRSNVDYAELMWEEFVQGIQTFFSHQASLSITSKKSTPHVIPYCRFKKLIIYYLGSRHNIHRRPESLFHVTSDDFPFGNLKFVPKGEKDEGQKKTASAADKPTKPTPVKKPAPAKQTKSVKEKSTKPSPLKKAGKGKVRKFERERVLASLLMKMKKLNQNLNLKWKMKNMISNERPPRKLHVVKGKGKSITTDEQRAPVTEEASTRPLTQPEDDTSANVVCNTPSPADAETGADTDRTNSEGDIEILNVNEDRGENVSNIVALEERTVELDEDQARSDPHEEHVHLENPLSSYGTLSSMKNLDDAFTYGDQFHNDKPNKEEPDKANVEIEVESMVMVLIYQASSSIPPLSTPIIIISSPKPVSPPIQELVFTATTTTTTTTLPPPPPPQQQSTIDSTLAARVTALEQICANFEKKNKVQDQTAQALSFRIFTLENHDLYSKFDKYINENVKEVVQDALQGLVRERFKELSEFEMKEILHDRMFESGSYRSLPEHTALYEALEASIDCENKEEFMDAMDKFRKRSHDDQDPHPPPLKDSDKSKKKGHDSNASASQ